MENRGAVNFFKSLVIKNFQAYQGLVRIPVFRQCRVLGIIQKQTKETLFRCGRILITVHYSHYLYLVPLTWDGQTCSIVRIARIKSRFDAPYSDPFCSIPTSLLATMTSSGLYEKGQLLYLQIGGIENFIFISIMYIKWKHQKRKKQLVSILGWVLIKMNW